VRITLENIYSFSLCPRYYKYSKQSLYPRSKRLSIVDKVIRRAYARQIEYGRQSQWKSIVGWIDKEVFKDVDINNEQSFFSARKLSENILVFIQKWYQFDYLRNDNPSYIDIPVSYDFGSNVVVDTIPIVQIKQDTPFITYIDELEYDNLKIYNNIRAMGWACTLLDELDINEIHIRHLFIGPNSGISSEPAVIKRDACSRVKETIRQIAISIRADITYPSYTEMCKTCEFKRRCRF
jgi:hypothetical protein